MAQKQPVGMAVAKFDYKTNDSHELNISKGEKLTLLDDSQHWWQVMNSKGETGYVPSNFCKKSKQSIFSSLRNTLGRKKSKEPSQPISCGASSVGTAPSSAGGRRSVTASPKNNNPHVNTSDIMNNGEDSNRTRSHDNNTGQNPAGNPFYSMGSLKSNGSNNKVINVMNPKTTQSMSYNAGQQISMSTDKHNQSQPNLPVQMPHYPVHKIPCSESQFKNTSFQQLNGRDYLCSGNSKSKYPISNSIGDNIVDAERVRQEPRMVGSSMDVGLSYPSNTGSLGQSSASCVAKFSYTPCQPDELALSRGDKIKVLEKSSDGWWRGELINSTAVSSTGWFPSNYVTLDRAQNNSGFRSATDSLGRPLQPQPTVASSQHHSSMPSVTSGIEPLSNHHHDVVNTDPSWSSANKVQSLQRYSTVLTLYPFSKNQLEEMSFDANEILEVIERPVDDPDWWRCRNVNGEVGLVPRNYVKQLTSTGALLHKPSSQPPPAVPPQSTQIFDQKLYSPNLEADNLRLGFNRTGRFKDRIWYWGNISRMECESLLITHGYLGQFVVRDSESHPGDLTITMHAGAKCRNFKVHIQNGEFHIGQKMFSSIEVLIQHYRTHPIYKSDNERLFLSDPFQYKTSMSNF